MNSRFLPFLAFLVVAGVAGCSDQRTPLGPSGSQTLGRPGVAIAKPDSQPPKPPPIPIVQFAGSDPVRAGGTSITRWLMGNDRNQDQTITWRLTGDAGWSSLPQSGSILVPGNSTRLLEVGVAAPDSALPGLYSIHLAATLRRDTAIAEGAITVFADSTGDSLRIVASRR